MTSDHANKFTLQHLRKSKIDIGNSDLPFWNIKDITKDLGKLINEKYPTEIYLAVFFSHILSAILCNQ